MPLTMPCPLERKTSVACSRDAIKQRACCALAILLVAPLAAAQPKPVMMQVVMVDYLFDPDHLTFEHDVYYQLHLENHGKETHEFTAPTFLATATIDNPDVLNREHTEVLVQPGESKDLFLTPHRPGTYDLRCADHDWDGMVGGITVK
jgi:uncharacterized cupredoxin-like copper-binding protein